MCFLFFFFSSRRRHTRCSRDWSSDVCSSDLSSPVTARSGILWAGAGMLVATLITFLYPGMSNYALILPAMLIGGGLAWGSGKRVAMTNIPQMIALYNGMGGGGAGGVAAGGACWGGGRGGTAGT